MDPEFKNKFKVLNTIVMELKEKKLDSALSWAKEHSKALEQINSGLLFNLHKEWYCSLIRKRIDLSV